MTLDAPTHLDPHATSGDARDVTKPNRLSIIDGDVHTAPSSLADLAPASRCAGSPTARTN